MTGQGRRTYAADFLTELFQNPLDPGYADAAERRRRGAPATGWRRSTPRAVTLVTLVVLGLLLAVAYRQTVAAEPSRSKARAGLVAQIKQREAENAALTAQADRLRAEVLRQRDAALSGSAAANLRNLEAATGLGRVRGDGLVVRVADAPEEADAVTGAGGTNLGRVLDRDLQDIANALWSGGAEAVSINGQRLTATSTIRAAGGAILVDFKPVIGPYEVSAIGPGQLERRFRDSAAARLLESVSEEHGMSFEFRRVDDLTLPAATEPRLRYATPSPEPAPTPSGSSAGGGGSPSPLGGGR
ncbi:hypothetical protein C6361_03860 [Plantactinospora sp. BC1]|uniref:DUF881 domain-containing protein n=1 Tax=Plantactinospora sp. BC1 TaxID=2108470 RepID=UPI000D15F61B|nr:DUF881 domain-containing protein [Plantactinospora sp. BC1]AVT28775.1 hypothetical protein C6361_03860 [Plantactinospora sp. BC1]